MGQAEIIEVLEKHKEPIPRRQIAVETGYDPIKVSHLLNKLMKKGEVKCIECDRIEAGKLLGLGRPFRRTRFFYV